ncbi:hypothetical protein QTP70_031450 [Hemibagrus guttatus]|uniref:Uncharacterized protein n=1 Tax=Hemibagrus guttatus TaxID=175788 RepID=A0AAE0UWV4_9TELE|nr:hypothetical protein QTP70_031450 [Hemibagrus guttatus]
MLEMTKRGSFFLFDCFVFFLKIGPFCSIEENSSQETFLDVYRFLLPICKYCLNVFVTDVFVPFIISLELILQKVLTLTLCSLFISL